MIFKLAFDSQFSLSAQWTTPNENYAHPLSRNQFGAPLSLKLLGGGFLSDTAGNTRCRCRKLVLGSVANCINPCCSSSLAAVLSLLLPQLSSWRGERGCLSLSIALLDLIDILYPATDEHELAPHRENYLSSCRRDERQTGPPAGGREKGRRTKDQEAPAAEIAVSCWVAFGPCWFV